MLPVSEEATTGTATGHFVNKTEKSTGKHGTKRESRRCPSLYARLFGPITGTDGTVFIPSISRTDYRLCGKYGQKTGPSCLPFFAVDGVGFHSISSAQMVVNAPGPPAAGSMQNAVDNDVANDDIMTKESNNGIMNV